MHWGVKINVFHIKAGKLRSMTGNDTVYNDIGKFEGSCGGFYILWINHSVANNGDSIPVGVVFMGEYLAHYFSISHLISYVCSYILISDDPESFSSIYLLFIDAFVAYPNYLTYPS